MIFITIGNEYRNFQRMNDLVIFLANKLPQEEFIFQYGHSEIEKQIPKNIKIHKFISRTEFKINLTNAKFVITHAGAGTLLQCFEKNIIPFVLPRRAELNEHLNNHQLDILNQFFEKKLCVNIDKIEAKEVFKMINNLNPTIKKSSFLNQKLLKKLKKSIYEII
tara:strand:- start:301 stop:792 length:492 start_codon:yes stop_codon:yes gene_type:complete